MQGKKFLSLILMGFNYFNNYHFLQINFNKQYLISNLINSSYLINYQIFGSHIRLAIVKSFNKFIILNFNNFFSYFINQIPTNL